MNEIETLVERLEAHIAGIGTLVGDEARKVDDDIRAVLIESKAWLEAHLINMRSAVSKPALTDVDAAADVTGTPRPNAAPASASNDDQPEPPAAA